MSVSNIAILPVTARRNPDAIIEAARNAKLKRVIIVGWDQDGSFFCEASESMSDTIFMLRNAEHELFKMMDAEEG